jgi:hypothetical protein
MTEDMQVRNFSPQTQRTCLHHIAGLEDLHQFQIYLASDCRYSAESLNQFVSAAKFLYGVTLEAPFDVGAGCVPGVSEMVALKVSHIDSQRMLLRVKQGKGPRSLCLPLSPPARSLTYLVARCALHWLAASRLACLCASHAGLPAAGLRKRITVLKPAPARHAPVREPHRHP